MQPPALERRSAVYKAQSLGSSLIHTIPDPPHQRLPCLEDTALIHTIPAPPQRSAVCRGHSLIHMIPAPHQRLPCFGRHCSFIHTIPASHQRLPCVEDSALSLIQGDIKGAPASVAHPLVSNEAAPALERQ